MVQKLKNIKFESLIFFISLLFSANFSKLFYNSYYSPDFEKYVMYIDYFTNRGGSPNLDQGVIYFCLLYTSPSPRDAESSRMPSSA